MISLRLAVCCLALVAWTGAAVARPPSGHVVTGTAPDVIDWTRGLAIARGAATASPRAPSAAVARIGAERSAREAARAALRQRVDALPLGDGRTVGAAVASDQAARARLGAALEASRADQVVYGTDGSVVVREAVPLEAVRIAIAGAAAPPAWSEDAPTAVVIDVPAGLEGPALGLAVGAGAARYHGPTIFYKSSKVALEDARLGARVIRARARQVQDGVLEVGGDGGLNPAEVTSLRDAGALVVLVLPGS